MSNSSLSVNQIESSRNSLTSKLAVYSDKSQCKVYNYLEKLLDISQKKNFLDSYDFIRFSPKA
jgi:hypothetical protein